MSFPTDIWTQDDSGRTDNPNLYLNENWGLSVARMLVGSDWQLRQTAIPGSAYNQLELTDPNRDQAVVTIKPRIGTYPDDTGTEATLTLFLSRLGDYDSYVDISLNRLSDPDVPVFVQYLRGDGRVCPKWVVASKHNSEAEVTNLELDPLYGLLYCKTGSVACKITEVGTASGLSAVTSTGDYYLDGTASDNPCAENGTVHHVQSPYSTNNASQEFQSFVNRTHRYVRVKASGTWSAWGLVTVA